MSEFETYDSKNKRKLSSTDQEHKRFENYTNKVSENTRLGRSGCPVRLHCNRETETQSTKINSEDVECRRESLSPSSKRQIIGYSSSTVNQSSNSTCFYSSKNETTSANLQHDKDIGCTSKDVFHNFSSKTQSSSLPTHHILSTTHTPKKSCFPIARSPSSKNGSTISTKDGSPSPHHHQVQSYQFDDIHNQNEDNANKLLVVEEYHNKLPYSNISTFHCHAKTENENKMKTLDTNVTDCKTNYSNKPNEKTYTTLPVDDSDMLSDYSTQINENVYNDEANVMDISEENQLLQEDPALRQFDVLDEFEGSDREKEELIESNSGESDLECNEGEELPIDDIDEMLDEGLPEKFKSSKNKESPVKLKRKVVLEEIGHDHFDLLPEGWIQIMHSCGMPVYLNQKSRVCTMARPYFLGPGSSRNHKIPLSAIPCLQYRRASELEKKNQEEREKKKQVQADQSQSEIELMSAEIETFQENEATQSLEASELHEYCKKAFKFKTLTIIPFKTWSDRRKYVKMRKEIQRKQRPTLPKGTKLLKFPIKNLDGTVSKGEWIINPNGKSYVCILHEYVQHALKKHPKYLFKELENPATPYSATVYIEDMEYGFGMGVSKKHAKVEAAKAALEVLIPGMKDKIEPDNQFGIRSGTTKRPDDSDISIFDKIKVEDPRVAEFCTKSTEPPPYAILLTCLSRNTGIGQIELSYETSAKHLKQDEFTLTVGNHKATVACKNKREGKQRAAQAILKALHPNIVYWGSLLRMYGNRLIKDIKEKKQEEQEITQLQSKASLNQPNYAVLNKLKAELLKLREKREALKAKGQFTLPSNIILPSLSSTDLNKINLSSNK